MRPLSVAFIIGLFAGSVVASELSLMSLYILLIALFLAGIFLLREGLRTLVFLFAFFVVGVVRMAIADVPLQLDGLVASFEPLRRELSEGFVRFGILGDENAVVNAMILGDKTGISHHLRTVYSQTGASHVLALSGMHLAIIYFMLSWLVMRTMLWGYAIPELLWEKLPVERNANLRKAIRLLLRFLPSELIFRNIISLIIVLAVNLLTAVFQGWRAATENPVNSIKNE